MITAGGLAEPSGDIGPHARLIDGRGGVVAQDELTHGLQAQLLQHSDGFAAFDRLGQGIVLEGFGRVAQPLQLNSTRHDTEKQMGFPMRALGPDGAPGP